MTKCPKCGIFEFACWDCGRTCWERKTKEGPFDRTCSECNRSERYPTFETLYPEEHDRYEFARFWNNLIRAVRLLGGQVTSRQLSDNVERLRSPAGAFWALDVLVRNRLGRWENADASMFVELQNSASSFMRSRCITPIRSSGTDRDEDPAMKEHPLRAVRAGTATDGDKTWDAMFVLTFTDGVVKWSPMDRLAIDERLRRWETPGPSIDPVDGSEQPF